MNYRYSSIALLNAVGLKIVGDAIPKFQDLTLNVFVPTQRAGSFQVFGLGGASNIHFDDVEFNEDFRADLGVLGINHMLPLGDKTYLKTSVSFSGTRNIWEYSEFVTEPDLL